MASKMVKIPHFDQATFSQMKRFFETNDFESTEKIDGSNISFGIMDGHEFVQTKKGKPEFGPEAFHELSERYPSSAPFHNAVISFQQSLIKSEAHLNLKYFADIVGLNLGVDDGFIQVFAEMVDTPCPNIVKYEQGRKIVLLYAVLNNESGAHPLSQFDQRLLFQNLMTHKIEGWELVEKNLIHIDLQTAYDVFKSFESEYGSAITCRKRNTIALKNKAAAKAMFERTLSAVKVDILKWLTNEKPMLGGDEIEGAVIQNLDTKQMLKIVNLEDFGKRRAEAWAGTDALKAERKQLHHHIVRNILNNPDILVIKAKQEQKVRETIGTNVSVEETLRKDVNESTSIYDQRINIQRALKDYRKHLKAMDVDERTAAVIADELQDIKVRINSFDSVSKDYIEHNIIRYLVGPKRMDELVDIVA